MELRRDFILTVGVLLAFNILLSLGAIGLFSRMGPAIERILQENVYSIEACEEMLSVLASHQGAVPQPDRNGFRQALRRARQNITESEETPILDAIESRAAAALGGNPQSTRLLVADVRRLIRINRQAMESVDQEARRLGTAGAWSAVFIALLSFAGSMALVRRLSRRVLTPLLELHNTLESVRQGDPYRRCHFSDVPSELRTALKDVNRLLDTAQEVRLSTGGLTRVAAHPQASQGEKAG
ncbi:MAG TPA: hypothetical protein VLV83_15950 [Acidobacteriota bacterium]|nr:hypothetical protein [Acidobacteriota bacterium]